MNPHFVLNFNLSSEATRGVAAGTALAADEDLPTPLTAGGAGTATDASGKTSSGLPSPLEGNSASVRASSGDSGLPTPFDHDHAAGAVATASELPIPGQMSHLHSATEMVSGASLPRPADAPPSGAPDASGKGEPLPVPQAEASAGGQGDGLPGPDGLG